MNDKQSKDVKFRPSGAIRLNNPAPGPVSNRLVARPAQRKPWTPRALLELLWPQPTSLVLAFLLTVVAVSLVIGFALRPTAGFLVRHSGLVVGLSLLVEAVATVAALALMARFVEHRPFTAIGFDLRGALKQIGIGAAIGATLALVTVWMLSASGDYILSGARETLAPWMPLVVCLAFAVANEVIFRGYIFRVLEYRYGSLIGLVGMIAVSAALHIAANRPILHDAPEAVAAQSLAAASTGLLLAGAYMTTRRLWMPIAVEWAWSFVAGPVLGLNLSSLGIVTHSIFRPVIEGGITGAGGYFGPRTTGASALVWTALGAALIYFAVRAKQWKRRGPWQPIVMPKKKR